MPMCDEKNPFQNQERNQEPQKMKKAKSNLKTKKCETKIEKRNLAARK